MAGIYIHLPFCIKKCGYCDFYSVSADDAVIEIYTRLLCEEMMLRKAAFPYCIHSIYLGGGTPSLLSAGLIDQILETVREHFQTAHDAEITIEVNPGTIDETVWAEYSNIGINRISLGVQSFIDEELNMLGRLHTADTARQAVLQAAQEGFQNIGIDLIYGLPGQSEVSWAYSLREAVRLNPNHVSAYSLSLSADVPLAKRIQRGELPELNEERNAGLMEKAHACLTDAGFRHYEISNFAKPGFECRHNMVYWSGEPYLGLGASAHSFDQNKRWWNAANLQAYCRAIQKGELPEGGAEMLDSSQQLLEKITLGLRTSQGVPMQLIESSQTLMDRLIDEGKARLENGNFILTAAGFLLADEIALRLTQ